MFRGQWEHSEHLPEGQTLRQLEEDRAGWLCISHWPIEPGGSHSAS